MFSTIYNPLDEFSGKFKDLHEKNTNDFFQNLVQQSGIDIKQNRATVKMYHEQKESRGKLKKKLGWLRFLRVLMCITLVLIPLVVLKMTPKIRALRSEIENLDKRVDDLLVEANRQMAPLNSLFTDRDALNLITLTIPQLCFNSCFSAEQETDMQINYDFLVQSSENESTVDVLSGNYNENPFLFEHSLVHTMGTETYHGYKTIHWTERCYIGGRWVTEPRSQRLHATVTKPKPFFNDKVVLNYCSQSGPNLSFSRDASHLERKNDKQIEKLVNRGEKKLKKKTDKAIRKNDDFVSMSNSSFEVLFDALDRTNEVQFRTLFTPLAQTNMVALLRSPIGFGDDFHFIKAKRTNKIISDHSQKRELSLLPYDYISHSYDIIKANFINKNIAFFKAVYFDFAPLFAIPIYQERPIHSLDSTPTQGSSRSLKECEALTNAMDKSHVVHPHTKTKAVLKSTFIGSQNDIDELCVTAYSYDIAKRTDYVAVWGGDKRLHQVPVEWEEFLPLKSHSNFHISTDEMAQGETVLARRNGMCLFK